eukprot:COSAG02_NODE_1237_length_13725_cov_27.071921_16_plen_41_part_00
MSLDSIKSKKVALLYFGAGWWYARVRDATCAHVFGLDVEC